MTMIGFIFYSFILVFVTSVSDATVIKDNEIQQEERVKVIITPNDSKLREKRSGNDKAFPNRIDVQIQGTELTRLKLYRVRRTPVFPTILSVTNHGLFQENIPDKIRDTGFYQDESKMAFVTLTKQNGAIDIARGSFVKDGQLHTVEKVRRNNTKDNEGKEHILTKVKQSLEFGKDGIVFDAKSHNDRYKRQVDESRNSTNGTSSKKPRELYLEYVIVVDHKSYKRWREKVIGNETSENVDLLTKSEIIQFYRHTVHGIDVIFSSASNEGLSFRILLTGIVICNESESCHWVERHKICDTCIEIDDQQSLMGFYQWRETVLLKRLKHDHAALFTGYDLYHTDMASKSTVGVSYIGTVCENWSVSVMEERRNALSIHTAAHELGHSFGAYHDGTTIAAACPGSDKYLMQSRMSRIKDKNKAQNPWTFSPCSVSSIMDYLDHLDRKDHNCLVNKPSYQKAPDQEPGLLFSADTQCRAILGQNSSVCREYHFQDWSSICYGIACNNLETGQCKSVLPYDGTPCGYKKWCKQGLCIYNEAALEVLDFCPLGDDPSYMCDEDNCNNTLIHNATCCETCNMIENELQGFPENYTTDDTRSSLTKISGKKNKTVTMTTPSMHSENNTQQITKQNIKTESMTTTSINYEKLTKTSTLNKLFDKIVTITTTSKTYDITTKSVINFKDLITKGISMKIKATETNPVVMTTEELTIQTAPIDKMVASTTTDNFEIKNSELTTRSTLGDATLTKTTPGKTSADDKNLSKAIETTTLFSPQRNDSYTREIITSTRETIHISTNAKESGINPQQFSTVLDITKSPSMERNDIIQELNSKKPIIIQNNFLNEASNMKLVKFNFVLFFLIIRSIL